MKITVTIPTEIEVDSIRINIPVRYDEEDIPNDFPLRTGDIWKGTLDLETGRIRNWPEGKEGYLHMKVCDDGIYTLMNGDEEVACINENYVPSCIPGEYGDYVILEIDEHGTVKGWDTYATPESVAISFFGEDDD